MTIWLADITEGVVQVDANERESSMMPPRGLSAQPIKGYGVKAVSSACLGCSIHGLFPPYFGIPTRFLQRSIHMFYSQPWKATSHEASASPMEGWIDDAPLWEFHSHT